MGLHGHYARKHPEKQRDTAISRELETLAREGRLDCTQAHNAAQTLGISPGDVGVQADLSELRLSRCQLGLFGYEPGGKRLDPLVVISEAIGKAMDEAVADGGISCAQCWQIANDLDIPKLTVGAACEKRGIHIYGCQLGAF